MSCWVVPMLAADLWNVPLELVLQRVRDGSLASKTEAGFLFVDVEPEQAPLPPTFRLLSAEELTALTAPLEKDLPASAAPAGRRADSDEQGGALGDWRSARQRTVRLRRPPLAA